MSPIISIGPLLILCAVIVLALIIFYSRKKS
jgi:hypothetical protein